MRTRTAAIAAGVSIVGAATALMSARVVLQRQAAEARRRIGKPLGEQALDADRVWRKRYDGVPVELLVLGDSIAAGLGAQRPKETLGARLAKGAGRRLHRPVRLRTAAIVGSESSALETQIDGLPDDYRADVAVIVVGGNDVTHRVPVSASVVQLVRAIERLRARGTPVVVGTCPDLGALRPVPQPLRSLGSRLSRQLAAAQAEAAEQAGARVVSTARAVGPFFISQPDEMFSLDRFHPSALGYRRTAEALLPEVLAALPAPADGPATARRGGAENKRGGAEKRKAAKRDEPGAEKAKAAKRGTAAANGGKATAKKAGRAAENPTASKAGRPAENPTARPQAANPTSAAGSPVSQSQEHGAPEL